jgi:hypothetical protein
MLSNVTQYGWRENNCSGDNKRASEHDQHDSIPDGNDCSRRITGNPEVAASSGRVGDNRLVNAVQMQARRRFNGFNASDVGPQLSHAGGGVAALYHAYEGSG